jgi:DNA-binding NarL/FixJ family response regulator
VAASTIAAVKMARRRWPQALVIALAETDRVEDGVTLVRQGADAWLTPDDGLDVLRTMLSRIADGERVLLSPPALAAIATSLSQSSASPGDVSSTLTSRESQVLQCFADGMSRPDIAARLKISRATLRTHVQNILHKLDLHSIDHAASLAAGADSDWTRSAGAGVRRVVADVGAAPDGA